MTDYYGADLVAPTKSKVRTNGIEIAYIERGSGDPLVLIMGLGADLSAWELHLRAYAEQFRCIAVDNRGAGDSDKPEGPYTTAGMADDYAGLIRSLGLGKVRVVGISMGGAIAQELAIRHPELVERMVLVSSWARTATFTREVFEEFKNLRSILTEAEFARLLQLRIWTPEYVENHIDELSAAREVPSTVPHHAFEAQSAACLGHDTIGRMASLRVPTLITVGGADAFTPLVRSEELRGQIPAAELKIFPGSGHAHHWEELEEFNRYTMEWLK
ncbi:alpha/beta fold hydrolase [Arthrobacter bambusae]|uniref:alpha/beta fold hydrolase n=1 Tax=Arthrobacter bambusae TaxID=1338426 RepID=UPI002787350B|nr:alpha/beta hydrolase [Arthrobacter bambusae]MDQ0028501.1 pimeloyl-ACP methyl ester carboxylesterase [Arthrobacter bambusae]MDQ0096705.1 pimeloyl-ACP methyl ester carboxylesterase [Arthrobacter bambusae]